MKKKKIYISIISLVVISLGFFLFFYLREKYEEKKYLTIYGNVDIRQVDLGFRVFGRVTDVLYDEGDQVKPGDLLTILDDIPYKEAVAEAEGRLQELEFAYKKAEAQFQKRYRANPNAISKEDYDDAFYNLEEMKANVKAAKAVLDRALTNLADTRVYCPTYGSILTRVREPGSVLNPGEPVFSVSIASPVWIRAYVSEPNLGKIYFGMPAKIVTDTKDLGLYHGHVGFISPVAEFTPKTVESLDLRTDLVYRLRVYVKDPDRELKQGMPVTVNFKLKD